jgi:hypothetical protein
MEETEILKERSFSPYFIKNSYGYDIDYKRFIKEFYCSKLDTSKTYFLWLIRYTPSNNSIFINFIDNVDYSKANQTVIYLTKDGHYAVNTDADCHMIYDLAYIRELLGKDDSGVQKEGDLMLNDTILNNATVSCLDYSPAIKERLASQSSISKEFAYSVYSSQIARYNEYTPSIPKCNLTTDQYSDDLIEVRTQKDFMDLRSSVVNVIKGNSEPTTLYVNIYPGTYIYPSNHIDLSNLPNGKNCQLIIQAIGTVNLIGSYTTYSSSESNAIVQNGFYKLPLKNSADFHPEYALFTDGKDIIELSDDASTKGKKVNYTSVPCIKMKDEGNNNFIYMMRSGTGGNLVDKTEAECKYMYLWHTVNFQSFVDKIVQIKSNLIYFRYHFDGTNDVNDDYLRTDGTYFPRYRIFNGQAQSYHIYVDSNDYIYIPTSYPTIRYCNAYYFVNTNAATQLKNLTIKGFNFIGSSGPVINLNTVNCDFCNIANNTFKGMWATAINADANNVVIQNNTFQDCYKDELVRGGNGYNNFTVINNTFKNCGKLSTNSTCVKAWGKDFYVANNTFEDFGYCAISLGGLSREANKDAILGEISGVVENNNIHYTDAYASKYERYTIMDGGAIYSCTKNDNTIIRYNRIDNYVGMYKNRGIYLDDGTGGVKVYGNVVSRVTNHYSIDLRYVGTQALLYPPYNSRNFCLYNVVDNDIRFEGKGDGTTFAGTNIFINSSSPIKDSDNAIAEKDNFIQGTLYPFTVSDDAKNDLKYLPLSTYVKNYLK